MNTNTQDPEAAGIGESDTFVPGAPTYHLSIMMVSKFYIVLRPEVLVANSCFDYEDATWATLASFRCTPVGSSGRLHRLQSTRCQFSNSNRSK